MLQTIFCQNKSARSLLSFCGGLWRWGERKRHVVRRCVGYHCIHACQVSYPRRHRSHRSPAEGRRGTCPLVRLRHRTGGRVDVGCVSSVRVRAYILVLRYVFMYSPAGLPLPMYMPCLLLDQHNGR